MAQKKIRLYQGRNFSGDYQELGEGLFWSYLDYSDDFMSIRIPAGMTVHWLSMDSRGGGGKFTSDVREVLFRYTGSRAGQLIVTIDAPAKVQIYSKTSHMGHCQRLEPGDYNIDRIELGDNQIRSVRVARGYRVTLFADPNFAGQRVSFTEDSSNIGSLQNAISSVRVEKMDGKPKGPAVTLYEGTRFGGRHLELTPGRYHQRDLGFFNNRATSLKVAKGLQVTLFRNDNFAGESATFTMDAQNLGRFNLSVSSLIVAPFREKNTGPKARVYVHPRFRPPSKELAPGRYDLHQIGLPNDSISSVKVPEGLRVTLFQHHRFGGRKVVFTEDASNLGSFNDQTSSIVVERVPKRYDKDVVTIFRDPRFGGPSHKLKPGHYDRGHLGLANDSISSVWVPRGLRVTLYEHGSAGGRGRSLTLDADASNLGDFDNLTTSLVVERIGAPPSEVKPSKPAPPAEVVAKDDERLLQLQRLGELPFDLFTLPFSAPFRFTGDISVSAEDRSITFEGEASIDNPFHLAAAAKCTLSTDEGSLGFMVRFALASSLAHLLESKVRPEVPGSVWSVLDSTVVPFLEVFDRTSVIIANNDGFDDELGQYVSGITFYTQIMGDTFEPFRTLHKTFPMFELDKRSLILSLGIRLPSTSKSKDSDASETAAKPDPNTAGGMVAEAAQGAANPSTDPDTAGGVAANAAQASAGQSTNKPATLDGQAGAAAMAASEGASKSGGGLSFLLSTDLLLNLEFGTPVLVFRSIGIAVDQRTQDISAAANICFDLNLGADTLHCRGGVSLEAGSAIKASIWGAIDVDDGAWKDPFGLKGLTFTGVGIQISATPNFPYFAVGVRGGIHLGKDVLGGDIAVFVDTGNPHASMLEIKSPEGIDLPQLFRAFFGPRSIVTRNSPQLRFKDFRLLAAPFGGRIAGQYYAPGFSLAGRLDCWGFDAAVSGSLDLGSGIRLQGSFDPIRIRAGGMKIFEFTDESGKHGPAVDFEFSATQQGGSSSGRVVILGGLVDMAATASIGHNGMEWFLERSTGIYYRARIRVNVQGLLIESAPGMGATVTIANRQVGLAVACEYKLSVDKNGLHQQVKFHYHFLGRDHQLGPYEIDFTVRNAEDLLKKFYEVFTAHALGPLLNIIKDAAAATIEWVRRHVTRTLRETAAFFKAAGAKAQDVARGLADAFSASPWAVVRALDLGASHSVRILRDVFGTPAERAASFLSGMPNMTEDAARSALRSAGYAANEVGDAIEDTFKDAGDWVKDRWDDINPF